MGSLVSIDSSRSEMQKSTNWFDKARRWASSWLTPPSYQQRAGMREAADMQRENAMATLMTNVRLQEQNHAHQERLQSLAIAAADARADLDRAFQAAQQRRQIEFNARIERERQDREDDRLAQRLSHDLVIQEKRMKFDIALAEFQKAKELMLAELHFIRQRELADDREVSAVYPLTVTVRSLRDTYDRYYATQNVVPPLVAISPLALEHEPSPRANVDRGFVNISNRIADTISRVFGDRCGAGSSHPVNYQGNGWRSKQFSGKSAIDNLHTALPFAPVIVLECKLNGNNIDLYIGRCNRSEGSSYEQVFSISWKDVLYPTAKRYAAQWRDDRLKLIDRGRSLEEIAQRRPVDEANLKTLEREEEDRELNMFDETHDYGYIVNDEKYIEELADFLATIGNLILMMQVDLYYLSFYDRPPQLPQLLPEILDSVKDDELKKSLVQQLQSLFWENLAQFDTL
ncbi:hypothetical protein H6G51_05530 [Limnothrix sp. FACHB-708]|uniref:hypothetical protein n=1 Tax=unclassified Limnothrix TaxID=2632864 RepID=UPI0016887593|nr:MULTISPECIES: hypothetical protein [unclassified Limnothrix]MBD2552732.1 hypothetical protein [Limnothrix sp. FACHB-708]MBD2590002.1 hypothetical protein [Limnothrix sp. FACHB-406]